MHPALHTRACELFGIKYPIVQTGMGWVSGVHLTAATAAAGGLGILAAVTMSDEQMLTAVREMRERTDAPFGVNLRPDQPDIAERVKALAREGVKVVSFAGAPTKDTVSRLHDAGVLCIVTVGMRRHAEKVAALGVDAVIAQGGEGGGHTGSVPTSLLLPQVVDAVGADIPVLAAGGFHDGRGLVSALAYGADGIAMGTRFLLTQESRVPEPVKRDHYLKAGVTDTVVTSAIDGRPQRVIRTPFVEALERQSPWRRGVRILRASTRMKELTGQSPLKAVREGLAMRREQGLTWFQVASAINVPLLIKAALVEGRPEAGVLPTGQVTGVVDDLPTVAELIERIIAEAESTLRRLESGKRP
ncbi:MULTISPECIES: NAD(P)H-dependent flavin oxidoreductase [Thermomonospora]|uniref:2-nitropropane dioxygenase NPD n=1 Tax=Thermomonospora curvata (strain ATCC 19995 / DSM 43183 / JCM 3096 / KCTC 9072 / NBRC 15933 / NCIMB 10081 / Henssen B9) TaxID=471852 RepID=D1A644_THECD|nr:MULTISPECIES: nitronate monooxygenase family protein [Thermomonospora]ACZ00143.1 2-nitropropane dioxygenase NPD [Thermomonospora curvata DSM 43183]PKK11961.1 MAG: nitronate monooxygenase [Thermomonospora sp. CIF 1]